MSNVQKKLSFIHDGKKVEQVEISNKSNQSMRKSCKRFNSNKNSLLTEINLLPLDILRLSAGVEQAIQTTIPSCDKDTCNVKTTTDVSRFCDSHKLKTPRCCACNPSEKKRKYKQLAEELMKKNHPLYGAYSDKLTDLFDSEKIKNMQPIVGFTPDGRPIYSDAKQLKEKNPELSTPVFAFDRSGKPLRMGGNIKPHMVTLLGITELGYPITGHSDLKDGMEILAMDKIITYGVPAKTSGKNKTDSKTRVINESDTTNIENPQGDTNITKNRNGNNKKRKIKTRRYPLVYDVGDCWPFNRSHEKCIPPAIICEKNVGFRWDTNPCLKNELPKKFFPGKIHRIVSRMIQQQRSRYGRENPERLLKKRYYWNNRKVVPSKFEEAE